VWECHVIRDIPIRERPAGPAFSTVAGGLRAVGVDASRWTEAIDSQRNGIGPLLPGFELTARRPRSRLAGRGPHNGDGAAGPFRLGSGRIPGIVRLLARRAPSQAQPFGAEVRHPRAGPRSCPRAARVCHVIRDILARAAVARWALHVSRWTSPAAREAAVSLVRPVHLLSGPQSVGARQNVAICTNLSRNT
jgi:hypothetical protein